MSPDEARTMAAELVRQAEAAERPDYKPGVTYKSAMGVSYVYTKDDRFISLRNLIMGGDWGGRRFEEKEITRPLTEEGK
jgi:hypothetical protein